MHVYIDYMYIYVHRVGHLAVILRIYTERHRIYVLSIFNSDAAIIDNSPEVDSNATRKKQQYEKYIHFNYYLTDPVHMHVMLIA